MSGRTYNDAELARAVAASRSWRGVLRELGLSATSSAAIRSVKQHSDRLELDRSHFTGQRRWTEDELAAAVAGSRTWTEVTARLGLSGGSSSTALKGHAARLGVEVGHLGRPREVAADRPPMQPDLTHLPSSGALLAAAWFSLCGYEVSWPLEPCRYDLLARRTEFLRVQVKTTRVRVKNTWLVRLHTGGAARGPYDPEDIDHFFVIDGEFGYYLIPVAAVGGLEAIHLSAYPQFRLDQQYPPVPTGSSD